ncbi:MAG: hypothetical protein IPJ74_20330 [Saprospiraceae bacterium]|nr:hypothetical protein [Saprospiraceae bacterium]
MIPNEERKIWSLINGKIDNIEDWNYLNPVGELSVLLKLLKSGLFELEEIETKFPNGRKKDFLFRHKNNNETRLIEILNIHLQTDIKDFNKIKNILLSKVQNKIDREIEGVKDSLFLRRLYILPVVWYLDIEDLENSLRFLQRV